MAPTGQTGGFGLPVSMRSPSYAQRRGLGDVFFFWLQRVSDAIRAQAN